MSERISFPQIWQDVLLKSLTASLELSQKYYEPIIITEAEHKQRKDRNTRARRRRRAAIKREKRGLV